MQKDSAKPCKLKTDGRFKAATDMTAQSDLWHSFFYKLRHKYWGENGQTEGEKCNLMKRSHTSDIGFKVVDYMFTNEHDQIIHIIQLLPTGLHNSEVEPVFDCDIIIHSQCVVNMCVDRSNQIH